MMQYDLYMQQMLRPMREELTSAGFKELKTPEEVTEELDSNSGTTLVFVNSVCGCAAGLARPAARVSLENEAKPDHLVTVFAGQEKEATAKAREYFAPHPPSSPSIALMKDGQLVHMIERHQIEGSTVEDISANLKNAFDQYCK